MATRINPFTKTGAAFATAAAVVAATPVIAPSMSLPTPPALSQAQYELTDFATFLQFLTDPTELEYALFTGWGGAIAPINVEDEEPIPDYWLPNCNEDCSINGPSGVAYMLLDALINGNQTDDVWPVSAVNYFFEGSLGTGTQYLAQQPFQPGVVNPNYDPEEPIGPDNQPYLVNPGPLADEAIFTAIALAWQGTYALTTLLLEVVGPVVISLVGAVPLVGSSVAEGIGSYLYGYYNPLTGVSGPPGLSGVLAYVTDTVTQLVVGLGDLLPSATAAAPAASLVAAAPALRSAVATPAAVETAPVVEAPVVSTPVVSEPVDIADSTPKTDVAVVETVEEPTVADVAVDPEPVADVSTPAEPAPVEITPVDVPADAVDDVAVSAPAETESAPVKAPKRALRGAADRVTKSIQSALGGSKAETAGASSDAGSADSAS